MKQGITSNNYAPGKRILFACVPVDGHFNPLTGLAMHLKSLGHDVRWYTSEIYAGKLKKLAIQQYTFKKAMDVNADNADGLFPERKHIKNAIKRLNFDLNNVFIMRSTEYLEDIIRLRNDFPFDAMICDCLFTAIPFVKERLQVPVISIGIAPLIASSKSLPPAGLGMTPSYTFFGKRKQDVLRFVADKILLSKSNNSIKSLLRQQNIKIEGGNLFDMLVRSSSLFLQSGVPGFEYKRSDLGKNIRFTGALLPYKSTANTTKWQHAKLSKYNKVILATQGTVEKDITKILVPTLEAFKNSDCLLIVTTGGSSTKQLQEKYAQSNIIIEDFIPFDEIMPHANLYITNGGYGGVLLAIQHKLPMIVAGVHEGKNEITTRVGYFKLGIDLKTETPEAAKIKEAAEKIFSDDNYARNVKKLATEFGSYNANELCADYILEALHPAISILQRNSSDNVV
jgi:MGT family glycosyltransferase